MYEVEWSSDSIAWYFDNCKVYSYSDPATIDQLQVHYLIINIAVGGWASMPDAVSIWPGYYEVEWVRVWQVAR